MMFAGIFISGCTATKFLKEDESFYAGSNIKIAAKGKIGDQGELKEQLKTLITPEPNGVF
jgi:outer membrane protein insertion porin family